MASTDTKGDTPLSPPKGVVCDPVTGVCRMPPGDGDAMAQSLLPLPQNLRSFDVLEDENGNKVQPDVLKGKMVGVYFSAGWCPPCRQFSPMLSKWAKERSKDVVIVFVSFDKSEQQMSEFTTGKGFLRMPFNPAPAREKTAREFEVQAIPTLVIVNGDTGAIVTTWGRSAVTKNPSGCIEEWKAGRSGVTWLQLLKPW